MMMRWQWAGACTNVWSNADPSALPGLSTIATPSVTCDNQWQLNKFFAETERRAFRLAVLAVGHEQEALDIVQDAMTRMVERYRHASEQEWGRLFHTILQNRIRDWYRRAKIRRLFGGFFIHDEDAPALERAVAPGGAPEQQLDTARELTRLEQALRRLPLRQQQVFLLRIGEGYDVEQTARIMKCSPGSVKTHLSRATAALRRYLGDDSDD